MYVYYDIGICSDAQKCIVTMKTVFCHTARTCLFTVVIVSVYTEW